VDESPKVILWERVAGSEDIPLPSRATDGSACYDLHSAEEVALVSGQVTLIRTGFRFRAPHGAFLEVRPRSGLSSRGVIMVNAPGTIDRDYAGEVKVPLTYLFPGEYPIHRGDRIAQLRLVEDHSVRFVAGRIEERPGRTGGFGSTGR
jgi:dUTP pyrophosphatase